MIFVTYQDLLTILLYVPPENSVNDECFKKCDEVGKIVGRWESSTFVKEPQPDSCADKLPVEQLLVVHLLHRRVHDRYQKVHKNYNLYTK